LAGSVHIREFWVSQFFRKPQVTIEETAARAVTVLGERLYGDGCNKDDPPSVALALTGICRHMGREREPGNGTRAWRGPYIRPVLSVRGYMPARFVLPDTQLDLLSGCGREPENKHQCLVTADSIDELEFADWAAYLRLLPDLREAHRQWVDFPTGTSNELAMVSAIRWELTEGARMRLKAVPRPSHFGL